MKLRSKLITGYWEGKRFIKQYSQYTIKVTRDIKQKLADTHRSFNDKRVYKNIRKELFTIFCNGFILWILMVGIAYITGWWKLANPLLIIPYGIIPWYSTLYYKEIKQNV